MCARITDKVPPDGGSAVNDEHDDMTNARRGVIGLLLLGACRSGTDAPPLRVIESIMVSVSPVARQLRLTLDQAAPVTVEYWADGVPRLRVAAPVAEQHALSLTRLRSGRTYQYEVHGTDATGTFTTDPLPDDLARVTFAATGAPTIPLVLLHLYDPTGYRGYAVVDGGGEVVWYWRTVEFPFGATRRQNGNFVFLDGGRGLVEVTPGGEVVAELPQDRLTRELHHDVVTTPDDRVLAIAFDDRTIDGQRVRGEAIWEWSPEGNTAHKRWSSWDHFSVTHDRGPRFNVEWMHANALAVGPRNNVLLSVHYWDQIVSIAPDWQRIEWRLGGVNATIPIADAERFSGQHTPFELSAGRLLLFDNGVERGERSRAVEFDIGAATARSVWEWTPQQANFAAAVGSARRLLNGHTLVAYGMSTGLAGSTGPTEVFEVSDLPTPRWHLIVGNTRTMYRAEPLSAIGVEEPSP
jgi:hypothetical protein